MKNDPGRAGLSPRSVTYPRAILRRARPDVPRWWLAVRNAETPTSLPRAVAKPVQRLTVEQVRVISTRKNGLGALMFVEPKKAKSRSTISLPAVAVEALKLQRVRQLERRVYMGADRQAGGSCS